MTWRVKKFFRTVSAKEVQYMVRNELGEVFDFCGPISYAEFAKTLSHSTLSQLFNCLEEEIKQRRAASKTEPNESGYPY